MDLKAYIRNVDDFPKKGIIFREISPLTGNKDCLSYATKEMARPFLDARVDIVVGMESRGFIFGSVIAYHLGAGFMMIRKAGKLPPPTYRVPFQTTYGSGELELPRNALHKGQRILIVDDVLAAGGTTRSVQKLLSNYEVEIVGAAYLIELVFLKGRDTLGAMEVHSLIQYS